MNVKKGLRGLGLLAGAAATVSVLAAPAAATDASVRQSVSGFGSLNFDSLGGCANQLSGTRSGDTARISSFSVDCTNGLRVRATNLSWTIEHTNTNLFQGDGVGFSVTTSSGTCSYRGDLTGGVQFSGIWSLSFSLNLVSGDCGGPSSLSPSNTGQAIDGISAWET